MRTGFLFYEYDVGAILQLMTFLNSYFSTSGIKLVDEEYKSIPFYNHFIQNFFGAKLIDAQQCFIITINLADSMHELYYLGANQLI